jgi:predicted permease
MIAGSVCASAMIDKLTYVFSIIALPMIAGYAVRRKALRRDPANERTCSRWSRTFKLICIAAFVPPIAATAMLKRPLAGTSVLVLALIGVGFLLMEASLGRAYIGLRKLPPRQGGAFLGCAAMTNMLSFGGLIVFAVWGNDGLQQVYLLKLLEHVLYFGVFYPWCSTFSPDLQPRHTGLIASFRRHPVTLVPLAAVAVGVTWNFVYYNSPARPAGPPAWTLPINAYLVPVQVGLLTFAVGLTLAPSRIRRYWPECLAAASIKFLIAPTVTGLAAYLCMRNGLISELGFRVAVVISSMPVAFNSLIPPALYNLDEDLANSCWLFTSAMLVVTVPALYLVFT